MKSKKKFLLLGVGVMGALALGVGATSTFAWFTAESTTQKLAGDKQEAVTVTTKSVAIGDIQLTFTITLSDMSNVELTDSTGADVKYEVGGTLYDKATPHKTGTCVVTVDYAVSTDKSVMAAALASDTYYKFQLQGKSNVRLLTGNDATSEQSGNVLNFYVECAASNGDLAVRSGKNSTSLGTQYYAVRTNNEWGVEINATNTTSALAGSHTYKQGDAVREGSDPYTYWVCKKFGGYTTGASPTAASSDSTNWQEALLHSADSIDIADVDDD